MYNRIAFGLAALMLIVFPAPSHARELCTLVVSAEHGEVVHKSGQSCISSFSPASTFKIPLALMGFDSGILVSSAEPAVPYNEAFHAPFRAWRTTVTPGYWLEHSVVWYSQLITRQLGLERFQHYVDAFDYGNGDLTGDIGQDNGLTHAWLSSSLKISPEQQVAFLRALYLGELQATAAARDTTLSSLPDFQGSNGWQVVGKTGTAFELDEFGNRLDAQFGWFVGWVLGADRTYVFATIAYERLPEKGFAGGRAKAAFLAQLEQLVP